MARKPAQIVKCPHCAWQGSARGLVPHCRLKHPSVKPPIVNSLENRVTTNPYAVKSVPKPVIGKSSIIVKDPMVGNVLLDFPPFNSAYWRKYKRDNPIEASASEIVAAVVIEWCNKYPSTASVTRLGNIPEDEGDKLTTHGVVRKGPRKRGN